MEKYKLGDTVMLTWYHSAPRATSVTKVGRKYFYVAGYREPFRLENGVSRDTTLCFVRTVAAHEKAAKEAEAMDALSRFGVNLNFGRPRALVVEIYDRLRGLIESAESEGRDV